jgi:hypothetical protein
VTREESAALVAIPLFRWAERAFWTAFLLLPFFTGLLQYDYLPNEYYDEDEHELMDSYDVEDDNGCSHEVYLEWRDKRTNEVYTREQFTSHRRSEGRRLLATMFFYGLIGCTFFAWTESSRGKGSFYELFGKAIAFNLVVAVLFQFSNFLH